jgi:acyl carrier protein
MTLQRSIAASVLAISLASCSSNAADTGSAGLGPGQSAVPAATKDSSVPPVLRSTVATTLKIDESRVVPAAAFAKDLGADELGMVELVMAYERVFEIRIPNADADRFKTVQDVIDYLRKKNVLR